MRPPKPSANAVFRATDGTQYTVIEVDDLPFVGEYQIVLASELQVREGVKVASITNQEFEVFSAKQGLHRVGLAR
jgi:uncharacterized protein YhfF